MQEVNVALVGQPNVGKSALFTRLTGVGVICSNYPGTTVEFTEGTVRCDGMRLHVHDLPGTNSLAGDTPDEMVTLNMLHDDDPDYIIAVVDATRLEGGLVLLFQLIELGYKVILCLNQMDVARKRWDIDVDAMSDILGIPVVPTVALTGVGIEAIVDHIVQGDVLPSEFFVRYDSHIESAVRDVESLVSRTDLGHPSRGAALKLFEGNPIFTSTFPEAVKERANDLSEGFEEDHGETIDVHINRDRYGEAGMIVRETYVAKDFKPSISERLSELTLRPSTGIPILLIVLGLTFTAIIYLGGFLDGIIMDVYEQVVGDWFERTGEALGGELGMAIAKGLDQSIQAILSLVIPYILVFYIILAVLEDSGYIPRVVVLMDGVMHYLGLHGRAVIPLIVGFGCNVPAVLATRVVGSRRERLIVATLVVMAIPCSAQTAIILGTVGNFSGPLYALAIYLILFVVAAIAGRLMNKWMEFEPTKLAMAIPDLRRPMLDNVASKTWMRTKEFIVIALPLLMIGSVIIEILMVYDLLDPIVAPMEWLTVGILGLPAVTIIAFAFGVLRKEMALGLLVTLLGLSSVSELGTALTPQQLFVFALVMATYVPCLATMVALYKEFDIKSTAWVTAVSMVVAVALGGLANLLFTLM